MKNFDKNSNGFANMTFVLILTVFISLYLTATFAIALSQQRDYVRTTCLIEATDHQATNLINVRALFNLNPESTMIRKSITLVKLAIDAATLAMQWEAIPPLKAKLNSLYLAQNTLDGIQKALITKAQLELYSRHAALVSKINSQQHEMQNPWRFMIQMSSGFYPVLKPVIPVRPDSEGGVGPNYEWQENAEDKLKLAYSWYMFFATKEQHQRFFTWMNRLNVDCSVTPDLRGQKWKLKISAGKL